jgi:hypothetical protein
VAAVSVRGRLQMLAIAVAGAVATLAVSGAAAGAVACPASASAVSSGPVQWEFSVIGAPTAGAAGVTSSWTRGRGSWSGGTASGTICSDDSGPGLPKRDLVLRVSGASTLSPQITRYGLEGVGIVLPVTVSASDESACPKGTHGSLTLFASYYSVHKDSIALRFSGGCSDHNHTFTGAVVKVLISRSGAQVNST